MSPRLSTWLRVLTTYLVGTSSTTQCCYVALSGSRVTTWQDFREGVPSPQGQVVLETWPRRAEVEAVWLYRVCWHALGRRLEHLERPYDVVVQPLFRGQGCCQCCLRARTRTTPSPQQQ